MEKKQIEAIVESVTVWKGFKFLLGFSLDFFFFYLLVFKIVVIIIIIIIGSWDWT